MSGLPHHALVRSWIVEGLRGSLTAEFAPSMDEPLAEQLNIKLDQSVLDELKARSDKVRQPYHRLARQWIGAALRREEERLGLPGPEPEDGRPPMKDLMVLLLHSPNRTGHDEVPGMTRLQKLLFVIEQKLASTTSFYAFNYGPFSEEVNDAAEALRLAGFLRGVPGVASTPPTFEDMMATVEQRSGPPDDGEAEQYQLSEEGHALAEGLRRSSQAYQQLYARIRELREEWDTPDLVDRVYSAYPKFTGRSLIGEKVARRRPHRKANLR